MGKCRKAVCICLMLCLLLCGCSGKQLENKLPPAIVTDIFVSYRSQDDRLYRHYTNTAKIDVILHYLYSLSPHGYPECDPEAYICEQCRITVLRSDGGQQVYRQYAGEYLSVDNHRWQRIDQKQGTVLFHLLNHIGSD